MDANTVYDDIPSRGESVTSMKTESDTENAFSINDPLSVESSNTTAPIVDESDLSNVGAVSNNSSSTVDNPSSSIPNPDEPDFHEAGATMEERLSSLLQSFQKNSANTATEHIEEYDSDYEEAVVDVDRKREEIATKESVGHSTDADRIELKTLEVIVNKLRKGREKETAHRARELKDQTMFIPEDAVNDDIEMTPAPSRREAMNEEVIDNMDLADTIDISDDEEEEDDRSPPQRVRGRVSRGSKNSSRGRKPKVKVESSRVRKRGQTSGKRGRGGRQGPTMTNIGSLLRNDIVGDARANQGAGEQPNLDGIRNKKDALAALIGSIPLAERGRGDKAAFDNAAKQFRWRGRGSMQVRDGGWRLKGMTTSLKNFQLLSAAWGCEREAGTEAPFGGMLADTMGYGKVSRA